MHRGETLIGLHAQSSDDADELFRAVFDASSNLMAITRPENGLHIMANKAWLDAMGYRLDEVVGKTAAELGVWETPEVRADIIALLEKHGTLDHHRARLCARDGSIYECSISIRPVVFGGDRLLLFSAQDITGHMKAETELRSSQALLTGALEAINEGFVLYDANGRLVLCNSTFRDFYGYSESETVPGVHRRELGRLDIERDKVRVSEHAWLQYIDRREVADGELPESYLVELTDGRVLLLRERRTADGGVVSIQSDITDLKRAEVALVTAKDEAQTANRAKTEFLANMSHELRTPLNSVLGFSEILSSEIFGALGDPRYREYAEAIHQAGSHLLEVIGDILDISRIEAGETTIEATDLEVGPAVRECIAMLEQRAKTAEVTVAFDGPAGRHRLHADPRHFRQVIINLLANAIKFTPQGGHVAVSARIEDAGHWRIDVEDNGIGIDSADLPRIVEPFVQVAHADSRGHGGTGLGLPICKSLMELHGGALKIASRTGEGTKVTLAFPPDRTVAPAA
jgi:PAS domain S-box-containing protein